MSGPPSDTDSQGSNRKMTKAEFLMAQVNLDPIESYGSQEYMSTVKPSLPATATELNSKSVGVTPKSSNMSSNKPPL